MPRVVTQVAPGDASTDEHGAGPDSDKVEAEITVPGFPLKGGEAHVGKKDKGKKGKHDKKKPAKPKHQPAPEHLVPEAAQ